ncbi:hypothetical protein QCA50_021196 [Cerrena zonata]|uniref:Uncharacterized protein n=1 Tax=Cerrena zonata TaxID=2478898 RepID=A0AAW0FCY9_9APHY
MKTAGLRILWARLFSPDDRRSDRSASGGVSVSGKFLFAAKQHAINPGSMLDFLRTDGATRSPDEIHRSTTCQKAVRFGGSDRKCLNHEGFQRLNRIGTGG